MTEIEKIAEYYKRNGSVKQTAAAFGLWEGTVRKALITAGVYESKWSARIAELRERGLDDQQIAEALHISLATVNTHTPYTKGSYNSETPTKNAIRIRRHRRKGHGEDD